MTTQNAVANREVEPLGEVFTRRWVVEWMLDLAGYTPEADAHEWRVVEPSCGSGAFLVPLVERLVASCRRVGVDLREAREAIWACDLHLPSVERSRAAVAEALVHMDVDEVTASALAGGWVHHDDFLLSDCVPSSVDLVLGNPPYVRHDEIPNDLVEGYRERWPTMRGRCDLYVPFYERGLVSLKAEGTLAYICADRWMRNQYGSELRHLIHRSFSVETVVRMHQVDAFEAEVDAYPAVTIISRSEQGDGIVLDCEPAFGADDVSSATGAKDRAAKHGEAHGALVSAAQIDGWFDPEAWPEGSPDELHRVAHWERTLDPLEAAERARVGIGVATGADKVFVVEGARPDVEGDRLIPLVKAKHITNGRLEWTPTWLVNPWDDDGVIDLADWPKAGAFFEQHRDRIARRHIAKRNPERWHRTIDRVHPSLTSTPKVLLADMKDRMTPVVDHGEYYPHHNLYWLTSDVWEIEVLAGLLLSDQAEAFVRAYCVKMRGGTLRMQAQYLRRIRLPAPSSLTSGDRKRLKDAYRAYDREAATAAAEIFYG